MAANSRGPRSEEVDSLEPGAEEIETAAVEELPEDLTVAETLAWVSGDKRRAQVALDAEEKRDKPRSGVTGELERLVNDETGAGIASGEA
jgi:hypothetical protein